MASKDIDDLRVDVMHVGTYIPLIVILLRAAIFLTLMEFLSMIVGQIHMLVVVSAWLVYLDAHIFKSNHSNIMCGFLVPVALMYGNNRLISIQFHTDALQGSSCYTSSSVFILYYALAVAWASSSMFMLVYVFVDLAQFRLNLQYIALFAGALGIGMLWAECSTKPFYELLVRAMLFYMFTFGFFLLQGYRQHLHQRRYRTIGMHIALHLLFVNTYIVAGSLILCLLLLIYLLRNIPVANNKGDTAIMAHTEVTFKGNNINAQNAHTNILTQTHSKEQEDALRELMLAKQAINMI